MISAQNPNNTEDQVSSSTSASPAQPPTSDHGMMSDSESSPHYICMHEPEPIDLTHLNIEASMMCLANKVRGLCGKADSPTLSRRTFRFKELDYRVKTEIESKKCSKNTTG